LSPAQLQLRSWRERRAAAPREGAEAGVAECDWEIQALEQAAQASRPWAVRMQAATDSQKAAADKLRGVSEDLPEARHAVQHFESEAAACRQLCIGPMQPWPQRRRGRLRLARPWRRRILPRLVSQLLSTPLRLPLLFCSSATAAATEAQADLAARRAAPRSGRSCGARGRCGGSCRRCGGGRGRSRRLCARRRPPFRWWRRCRGRCSAWYAARERWSRRL
jgi:hypothetical protein